VILTRWHSPNPVRCAEWIPGSSESVADVTALLGEELDADAHDGTFTLPSGVTVYPGWWVYRDEFGVGVRSPVAARAWLAEQPAPRSSGSGF